MTRHDDLELDPCPSVGEIVFIALVLLGASLAFGAALVLWVWR
jgi:hypothetical protein